MANRWKSFAILLTLWAVIYLPLLGRQELVGLESFRVLPAVEMLEGGSWLLPRLRGAPYYNKPPGMQWAIAASFAVTGSRSEWAARLPSALMMLGVVAMMIFMRSGFLDPLGRFLVALIFLTCIGTTDVGRRAEIDGPYMCLTAMAILWWLNVWSRKGSRWWMWMGPAVLLSYGALMKGPINGAIFYITIFAVLAYSRQLRELLTVPHFAAVAVILAVCLGWVLAAYYETKGQAMLSQWAAQWLLRFNPEGAQGGTGLIRNRIQAILKLLPWLAFVPLLWHRRLVARVPQEHLAIFKGCRLAMVVAFVAINAMPRALPRYSLPVFPLPMILIGWLVATWRDEVLAERLWKWAVFAVAAAACLSMIVGLIWVTRAYDAWIVAAATFAVAGCIFWRRRSLVGPAGLGLATAAIMAALSLQYAVPTIPGIRYRTETREKGREMDSKVAAGGVLYTYCQGEPTPLFYLHCPVKYLTAPQQIDSRAEYLLISDRRMNEPEVARRLSDRSPKVLCV